MKISQGSVLGLMGLVLVAAVGLQAIRGASPTWAMVICNGTAALLLFATIRARVGPSPDARAFWFGFAVFGWSYLLLHTSGISERLITRKLFEESVKPIFYSLLPFPTSLPFVEANHSANVAFGLELSRIYLGLTTVGLAYLGGRVLLVIDRRARRRAEAEAEASSPPEPVVRDSRFP